MSPAARRRRGSPRAWRRGPSPPSTSAWRTRSAAARRGPPRSPGPGCARRRSRTRPGPATIGHSRRGRRSLRRVCSRIESSTAPNTSFWRWSNAPLPIRTGLRAGVARELVAVRLGQVAPAVDAVHDLQRAVVVRLEVGDELHELVGLPVEVEVVQRLQRERRVAHPRVAVVPVALAARRLGQRGRQRRHRRPGRHVRQPLDRQRRALDRLAPAMVGQAGARRASRARSARVAARRALASSTSCGRGEAPPPRRARSRPARPA